MEILNIIGNVCAVLATYSLVGTWGDDRPASKKIRTFGVVCMLVAAVCLTIVFVK